MTIQSPISFSSKESVYFIADIAANHDGDFERAKKLIQLCAEAGADAAKFQNFKAETIVSDYGFKNLGTQLSHQKDWEDDVYNVYDKASLNMEWTEKLRIECQRNGIDYLTTPYDLSMINQLDKYVGAWKLGSGDINWHKMIKEMLKTNKPLLIATGASNMQEVESTMELIGQYNYDIVLMQCNTNYTGSLENFKHINLNVISSFRNKFPHVILGLSDHTPGHSTVLGAITLGAKVIEKHFTDDVTRKGPDHKFSMDPDSWSLMVKSARELELALGDGLKKVEANEIESRIVQRRAIRASTSLPKGHILKTEDLVELRPCPTDGLEPCQVHQLLGKKLTQSLKKGQLVNSSVICL